MHDLCLLPVPRYVDLGRELTSGSVVSSVIESPLRPQGYELRIDADGVYIRAGDEAGLAYAHATLQQLRRGFDGRVPVGTVRDAPDIQVRGVMLDISRDKVPALDTLIALVRRLASWKINHVELYMEHTFAYSDHREVHRDASPLNAADIRRLDKVCAELHIDLVPCQNTLGHMERWLVHDRYMPLALKPDGFVNPHGMRRPAMTIDPAHPASRNLVRGMLAELVPLFRSSTVHVGLDETWELGDGGTDGLVDWLAWLRGLPELEHHELLVWGDMLAADANQLARIPAGVTVCEWGYEAEHPFDERCAMLAAAARSHWVAPGTSTWLSVAGRLSNARANCERAARAAVAHGAPGFLVTDWGDEGHLQPLAVSELALASGAAVAWGVEANAKIDLARAASMHVFDDPSGDLSGALVELGNAYRHLTPPGFNSSAATRPLYYPQLRERHLGATGVAEVDLLDAAVESAAAALGRASSGRPDGEQLVDEAQWVATILRAMVVDLRARRSGDGSVGSIGAGTRQTLAHAISESAEEHGRLWLARNRPGGLGDSTARLRHLAHVYETGEVVEDWGGMTEPA